MSLTFADAANESRLEWMGARADAETVPCRTCHVLAEQTCRNVHTDEPLRRLPAHSSRIADAQLAVAG